MRNSSPLHKTIKQSWVARREQGVSLVEILVFIALFAILSVAVVITTVNVLNSSQSFANATATQAEANSASAALQRDISQATRIDYSDKSMLVFQTRQSNADFQVGVFGWDPSAAGGTHDTGFIRNLVPSLDETNLPSSRAVIIVRTNRATLETSTDVLLNGWNPTGIPGYSPGQIFAYFDKSNTEVTGDMDGNNTTPSKVNRVEFGLAAEADGRTGSVQARSAVTPAYDLSASGTWEGTENSGPGDPGTPSLVPECTSNFTATIANGDRDALLRWTAVEGATGYVITVDDETTGQQHSTFQAPGGPDATSVLVTNLDWARTYKFGIDVVGTSGRTGICKIDYATVVPPVARIVNINKAQNSLTALKATNSGDVINNPFTGGAGPEPVTTSQPLQGQRYTVARNLTNQIAWEPVIGAVEFHIFRNLTDTTPIAKVPASQTFWQDNNKNYGDVSTYVVRASNLAGYGGPSNVVSLISPPTAPNVIATARDDSAGGKSENRLNWTGGSLATTDGYAIALESRVDRKVTSSDVVPTEIRDQAPKGTTEYRSLDIEWGSSTGYYVTPMNAAGYGESANFTEASQRPAPVLIFSVSDTGFAQLDENRPLPTFRGGWKYARTDGTTTIQLGDQVDFGSSQPLGYDGSYGCWINNKGQGRQPCNTAYVGQWGNMHAVGLFSRAGETTTNILVQWDAWTTGRGAYGGYDVTRVRSNDGGKNINQSPATSVTYTHNTNVSNVRTGTITQRLFNEMPGSRYDITVTAKSLVNTTRPASTTYFTKPDVPQYGAAHWQARASDPRLRANISVATSVARGNFSDVETRGYWGSPANMQRGAFGNGSGSNLSQYGANLTGITWNASEVSSSSRITRAEYFSTIWRFNHNGIIQTKSGVEIGVGGEVFNTGGCFIDCSGAGWRDVYNYFPHYDSGAFYRYHSDAALSHATNPNIPLQGNVTPFPADATPIHEISDPIQPATCDKIFEEDPAFKDVYNCQYGTGVPYAPKGFQVNTVGSSSQFRWTPVPGATGYEILSKTVRDGIETVHKITSGTTGSFLLPLPKVDTNYYIRTINPVTSSVYTATALLVKAPIYAPANFNVVPSNSRMLASWLPAERADKYRLFKVEAGVTTQVAEMLSTNLNYTLDVPLNDTTYYVVAVDDDGDVSPNSNTITVPGSKTYTDTKPAIKWHTDVNSNTITVTWDAVPNTGEYVVSASRLTTPTSFETKTVSGSATSVSFAYNATTGSPEGLFTVYGKSIWAKQTQTSDPYTAVLRLDTPGSLDITRANATAPISLDWADVKNATEYRVYAGTTLTKTVPATGGSATTIPMPTADTTYKVVAYMAPLGVNTTRPVAKTSPDSSTFLVQGSAVYGARKPVITSSSFDQTQVTVNWGALTDSVKYTVEVKNALGDGATVLYNDIAANTFKFDYLSRGQIIEIRVAGTNKWHVNSAWSDVHNRIIRLDPPKNFTIVPGNGYNAAADATWDVVPGAEGYRVYLEAGTTDVLTATVTGNSADLNVPQNNSVYYVVAFNSYTGESLPSTTASIPGFGSLKLQQPTITSAVITAPGKATVTWTTVPGATRYDVRVKNRTGDNTAQEYVVGPWDGTKTSMVIDFTDVSQVLEFEVVGLNAWKVTTQHSPVVSVRVPLAAPTLTWVPGDTGTTPATWFKSTDPVTGPVAKDGRLSWAAVPRANYYTVYKNGVQVATNVTATTYTTPSEDASATWVVTASKTGNLHTSADSNAYTLVGRNDETKPTGTTSNFSSTTDGHLQNNQYNWNAVCAAGHTLLFYAEVKDNATVLNNTGGWVSDKNFVFSHDPKTIAGRLYGTTRAICADNTTHITSQPITHSANALSNYKTPDAPTGAPTLSKSRVYAGQSVTITFPAYTCPATGAVTGYYVYIDGVLKAGTRNLSYNYVTPTGFEGTQKITYKVRCIHDNAANNAGVAGPYSIDSPSVDLTLALRADTPKNVTWTPGDTSTTPTNWFSGYDAVTGPIAKDGILSWDAVTVDVDAYNVYRNGVKVATVTGTTYSVPPADADQAWTVTSSSGGNFESDPSVAVTVKGRNSVAVPTGTNSSFATTTTGNVTNNRYNYSATCPAGTTRLLYGDVKDDAKTYWTQLWTTGTIRDFVHNPATVVGSLNGTLRAVCVDNTTHVVSQPTEHTVSAASQFKAPNNPTSAPTVAPTRQFAGQNVTITYPALTGPAPAAGGGSGTIRYTILADGVAIGTSSTTSFTYTTPAGVDDIRVITYRAEYIHANANNAAGLVGLATVNSPGRSLEITTKTNSPTGLVWTPGDPSTSAGSAWFKSESPTAGPVAKDGRLSWTGALDAVQYNIYKNGVKFTTVTGTSYVTPTVDADETWYVTASQASGSYESTPTNSVLVKGRNSIPKPTGVSNSINTSGVANGLANDRLNFVATCPAGTTKMFYGSVRDNAAELWNTGGYTTALNGVFEHNPVTIDGRSYGKSYAVCVDNASHQTSFPVAATETNAYSLFATPATPSTAAVVSPTTIFVGDTYNADWADIAAPATGTLVHYAGYADGVYLFGTAVNSTYNRRVTNSATVEEVFTYRVRVMHADPANNKNDYASNVLSAWSAPSPGSETVNVTSTVGTPGAFAWTPGDTGTNPSLWFKSHDPVTGPVAKDGKLTWTAATGATHYKIWKNGTLVATVTGLSYTVPSEDADSLWQISALRNGYAETPLSAGITVKGRDTITKATSLTSNFTTTSTANLLINDQYNWNAVCPAGHTALFYGEASDAAPTNFYNTGGWVSGKNGAFTYNPGTLQDKLFGTAKAVCVDNVSHVASQPVSHAATALGNYSAPPTPTAAPTLSTTESVAGTIVTITMPVYTCPNGADTGYYVAVNGVYKTSSRSNVINYAASAAGGNRVESITYYMRCIHDNTANSNGISGAATAQSPAASLSVVATLDTPTGVSWTPGSTSLNRADWWSATALAGPTVKPGTLSWNAVTYAERYRIYKNGVFVTAVTGTSYTTPVESANATYTVSASRASGSHESAASSGYVLDGLSSVVAPTGGLSTRWSTTTSYTNSPNRIDYNALTCAAGTTAVYYVEAVDGAGVNYPASQTGWTFTQLAIAVAFDPRTVTGDVQARVRTICVDNVTHYPSASVGNYASETPTYRPVGAPTVGPAVSPSAIAPGGTYTVTSNQNFCHAGTNVRYRIQGYKGGVWTTLGASPLTIAEADKYIYVRSMVDCWFDPVGTETERVYSTTYSPYVNVPALVAAPATPTNFTVDRIYGKTAHISWAVGANTTHYDISYNGNTWRVAAGANATVQRYNFAAATRNGGFSYPVPTLSSGLPSLEAAKNVTITPINTDVNGDGRSGTTVSALVDMAVTRAFAKDGISIWNDTTNAFGNNYNRTASGMNTAYGNAMISADGTKATVFDGAPQGFTKGKLRTYKLNATSVVRTSQWNHQPAGPEFTRLLLRQGTNGGHVDVFETNGLTWTSQTSPTWGNAVYMLVQENDSSGGFLTGYTRGTPDGSYYWQINTIANEAP